MKYAWLTLAGLCVLARAGVLAATEKHPITPDAEVQAQIDRAARAVANANLPWVDRYRDVETLRNVAQEAPKRLVRQVFYYASKPGTEEAFVWGALFIPAHFQIGKSTLAEAVIPYIDTDHSRLRQLVDMTLTTVENYSSQQPPDFSWYAGFLRSNPEAPPAALVRHMFARDPSLAFRQLLVVCALPPLGKGSPWYEESLWAENVVSDAVRKKEILDRLVRSGKAPRESALRLQTLSREEANLELATLSKHEAWWTRLYVAEILRQHPQFRTPEVIERLKADPHELVRGAILDIDKGKSQK